MIDAVIASLHDLLAFVLDDIDVLTADFDADIEPWGAAGRSLAEHVTLHLMAHVSSRFSALFEACEDYLGGDAVDTSARWLHRAVCALEEELHKSAV